MARKRNVGVIEDEELEEDGRAASVLDIFFGNLSEKRKENVRRHAIPASLVVVLVMLPVVMGAIYFLFFADQSPLTIPTLPAVSNPEAPVVNPVDTAAEQPASNTEPEKITVPEQVPSEPEIVVLQPTLNPMLVAGNPSGEKVSAEVLVSKFNEQITTHIEPSNVGLIPPRTGNQLFDAITAMKYSYGNTESQMDMAAIMQNSAEFVKASASNGDKFAISLREATYYEFKTAANNAIGQIPALEESQILPAANDIGYYASGMWYLAVTPEEYAEWDSVVQQASAGFTTRVQEIEKQKAERERAKDPNVITGPSDDPNIAPENQGNENPAPAINPNPDAEIVPDPDPAKDAFSEAESRAVAPDMSAFTVKVPTLTDYSTFPVNVAAPLTDFSLWALSPEGVVRAIQQLSALLKTGTAGEVHEWLVWNSETFETPFGKAWLFTVVKLETAQARWGEMTPECQAAMSQLLTSPEAEEANAWRDQWKNGKCADFLDGAVFNQGKALVEIDYGEGRADYILHRDINGKVDVMGALWIGLGDQFPLKVGQTIKPRSLINIAEGLLKKLFNLP